MYKIKTFRSTDYKGRNLGYGAAFNNKQYYDLFSKNGLPQETFFDNQKSFVIYNINIIENSIIESGNSWRGLIFCFLILFCRFCLKVNS